MLCFHSLVFKTQLVAQTKKKLNMKQLFCCLFNFRQKFSFELTTNQSMIRYANQLNFILDCAVKFHHNKLDMKSSAQAHGINIAWVRNSKSMVQNGKETKRQEWGTTINHFFFFCSLKENPELVHHLYARYLYTLELITRRCKAAIFQVCTCGVDF